MKAGFDPTAPDLHLGHTVLLRKMKHFQDLGHTVIFLIGDMTGHDRRSHRPQRHAPADDARGDRAQRRNLQGAGVQDPRSREDRGPLQQRVAGAAAVRGRRSGSRRKYTVARILERDDFAKRYKEGAPISMHELLYPLAQGYDSVALQCDVEMGGTDQKFNLLVGRELQSDYGQPPQIVATVPLLEGLDGVEEDVEVARATTSASPSRPR